MLRQAVGVTGLIHFCVACSPTEEIAPPDLSANETECAEASHSLTEDGAYSWIFDLGLSIDGSASLVLCAKDEPLITPDQHEELLATLGELVRKHHFAMMPICLTARPDGNPPDADPKVTAEYRADYESMLRGFNAVFGSSVVKRVDCQFGWTHHDELGKPLSGSG